MEALATNALDKPIRFLDKLHSTPLPFTQRKAPYFSELPHQRPLALENLDMLCKHSKKPEHRLFSEGYVNKWATLTQNCIPICGVSPSFYFSLKNSDVLGKLKQGNET